MQSVTGLEPTASPASRHTPSAVPGEAPSKALPVTNSRDGGSAAGWERRYRRAQWPHFTTSFEEQAVKRRQFAQLT